MIDPKRRVKSNLGTQQMPFDWYPFEGMKVVGYPKFTISGGKVIVDDYTYCDDRGNGKFLQDSLIEKYLEPLLW
jgi:dihydroorotase-like cyclic amidohydrolase